jgi:hypothetical protein
MECHAKQWNAMRCIGMPCEAMKCHTLKEAMECHAFALYGMPCGKKQWNAMRCIVQSTATQNVM